MDTLIYGDGTKTILLGMKQQFQIYINFVEHIKDNYEKLPESGLKRLNKCHFYTHTHEQSLVSGKNIRIQDRL